MEKTWEIEQILRQDRIDKKKAGRGEKHKASRKKGFKGNVRFPSDSMSRVDAKKYKQAGEWTSYNMYTGKTIKPTIPEWARFQHIINTNQEQASAILRELIQHYKHADLKRAWDLKQKAYESLRSKLGIEKDIPRGGISKKTEVTEVKEPETVIQLEEPVQELKTILSFTNQYEPGKDIETALMTLGSLLQTVNKRIEVSIVVKEV